MTDTLTSNTVTRWTWTRVELEDLRHLGYISQHKTGEFVHFTDHDSREGELLAEIERLSGKLSEWYRTEAQWNARVMQLLRDVAVSRDGHFEFVAKEILDGHRAIEGSSNETNDSDSVSVALFERYRRCLYRANGRLIQLGQEPEKLEYPTAAPERLCVVCGATSGFTSPLNLCQTCETAMQAEKASALQVSKRAENAWTCPTCEQLNSAGQLTCGRCEDL